MQGSGQAPPERGPAVTPSHELDERDERGCHAVIVGAVSQTSDDHRMHLRGAGTCGLRHPLLSLSSQPDAVNGDRLLLSGLADQQKKATRSHGGPNRVAPSAGSSALRFLKDGINVSEGSFMFSVSAVGYKYGEVDESGRISPHCVRNGATVASSAATCDPISIIGDVTPVLTESLDIALWKIGGPAVALRIVELANVSYPYPKLR